VSKRGGDISLLLQNTIIFIIICIKLYIGVDSDTFIITTQHKNS